MAFTEADTEPSEDHKMSIQDDDDDPIVSSVPVYLNHTLAHQVYLIQYPLRPSTRPYHLDGGSGGEGAEAAQPEIKLKPTQHRLAFSYQIDTTNATSEQYDANHNYPVRQLHLQTSVVAQAQTPTQTPMQTNTSGTTTPTTKSSPAVTAPPNASSTISNYTLASYSAATQSLHLTPITTILRALPDMAYVAEYSKEAIEERERKLDREFVVDDTRGEGDDDDAADPSTVKAEKTADEDGGNNEGSSTYKPLLMRFRKRETERSAAMRQRSYAYLQQQDLKEEWLTLKYHNSHSERAERAKAEGLIHTDITTQQSALPVMQSFKSYMQQLLFGSSAAAATLSSTAPTQNKPRPKQPHTLNAADDALQRKLLILLRSSYVLSTRQLCRLFHVYTPADLQPYLQLLQQHAHFTHGNWIARSSILNTVVHSARLTLCRNYLIACLVVHGSVNKAEMAEKMKLSIDDYNGLFNELCTRQLADSKDSHVSSPSASRGIYTLKLPNDDVVAASLSEIADKHQQECQQMLQATSYQLEQTSLAAVNAASLRSSTAATPLHGRQTSPTSQHKPLAATTSPKSNVAAQQQSIKQAQVFVNGLLREHGICNRQFIEQQLQKQKQQLQKQQRSTPPVDAGSYLQLITTELLTQVLQSSCYCLTPTLFATKSTNNEQTDRFRHSIGQLLVKKGKVKKAEVEHAIAASSNGDTLDYRTYTSLMKEFAVFDKSVNEWKLKAGTG